MNNPLLQSPVLKDLRRFVLLNDEVPFAQPILKDRPIDEKTKLVRDPSFEESGVEPPKHVPKWLPCFPNVGFLEEFGRREREFERKRWEEQCGVIVNLNLEEVQGAISKISGMDSNEGKFRNGEERGRVRFKLLGGKTENKLKEKMNRGLFGYDEREEDNLF